MVGISEAGLKCQMHEKPKEKENFKVCSLKKKKRKLQLQAKIPSVIVFFLIPTIGNYLSGLMGARLFSPHRLGLQILPCSVS